MNVKQKKPVSGNFRVRHDPPTLEEAIFAAQGLTDDIEGQTEIAAMLMGMSEDEVRPAVVAANAKATKPARSTLALRMAAPPASGRPVVVVERRAPRVLMR